MAMDGAVDVASDDDPPIVRATAWAAHPFSSNMSAVDWILFLGLIIAASVAWGRLIRHFAD